MDDKEKNELAAKYCATVSKIIKEVLADEGQRNAIIQLLKIENKHNLYFPAPSEGYEAALNALASACEKVAQKPDSLPQYGAKILRNSRPILHAWVKQLEQNKDGHVNDEMQKNIISYRTKKTSQSLLELANSFAMHNPESAKDFFSKISTRIACIYAEWSEAQQRAFCGDRIYFAG